MAILCLATDIADLKNKISKITIGYTRERQPVTVADLKVEGALMDHHGQVLAYLQLFVQD